jgi:hypothetical protein
LQETAEERMTVFAVIGEQCKKDGHHPTPPPLEIVKFPGLSPFTFLEKGIYINISASASTNAYSCFLLHFYPLLEMKVDLE